MYVTVYLHLWLISAVDYVVECNHFTNQYSLNDNATAKSMTFPILNLFTSLILVIYSEVRITTPDTRKRLTNSFCFFFRRLFLFCFLEQFLVVTKYPPTCLQPYVTAFISSCVDPTDWAQWWLAPKIDQRLTISVPILKWSLQISVRPSRPHVFFDIPRE